LLDSVELDKIAPEPLLFQTGYLTVKEVHYDSWSPPVFILEIPNLEVRDAFSLHIIDDFTESGHVRAGYAAGISGIERMSIVRQNFGFDLVNQILEWHVDGSRFTYDSNASCSSWTPFFH